MKKIIIYSSITILSINYFFAQSNTNGKVGINTEKPHTSLDINGDFNMRKISSENSDNNLYLTKYGRTENTLFKGQKDFYVASQGNNPAAWRHIKNEESKHLYLAYINYKMDGTGLKGLVGAIAPADDNNEKGGGFLKYYLNDSFYKIVTVTEDGRKRKVKWLEITDLTEKIKVTKPTNNLAVSFESAAQVTSTTGNNYTGKLITSYACGIFLNNMLKSVRVHVVSGVSNTIKTFDVTAHLENLAPDEYEIKVACHPRGRSARHEVIKIGAVEGDNDTLRSVLTIQLLEANE